jgi:hypothetical protein
MGAPRPGKATSSIPREPRAWSAWSPVWLASRVRHRNPCTCRLHSAVLCPASDWADGRGRARCSGARASSSSRRRPPSRFATARGAGSAAPSDAECVLMRAAADHRSTRSSRRRGRRRVMGAGRALLRALQPGGRLRPAGLIIHRRVDRRGCRAPQLRASMPVTPASAVAAERGGGGRQGV